MHKTTETITTTRSRRGMKTAIVMTLAGIAAGSALLGMADRADLSRVGTVASVAQEGEPAKAEQSGTLVSVTGEGRVTSTPDRASVSIGVSHEADTAAEAQAMVSSDLDTVIKAMRGLDVEGMLLTTSNLSLSPVYDYVADRQGNRSQRPRGYRASNTVSVRIDDIDRLGEVLDAAVLTGSNEVHGVSFELSDPRQAELDALADATTRAHERAEAIARALGREVEAVLEVAEQGAQPSPMLKTSMARGMMMESAPTPIEPGELSTTVRVTMTVRLAD